MLLISPQKTRCCNQNPVLVIYHPLAPLTNHTILSTYILLSLIINYLITAIVLNLCVIFTTNCNIPILLYCKINYNPLLVLFFLFLFFFFFFRPIISTLATLLFNCTYNLLDTLVDLSQFWRWWWVMSNYWHHQQKFLCNLYKTCWVDHAAVKKTYYLLSEFVRNSQEIAKYSSVTEIVLGSLY